MFCSSRIKTIGIIAALIIIITSLVRSCYRCEKMNVIEGMTIKEKRTHFDDDQDVYLKDNFTGETFNLRNDQGYGFSSEIGTFNTRFEIVFKPGEALSTEEQDYQYNLIYFNSDTNKLFVKGLETDVKQVMVINMLGQTIQEFNQVQAQTLNNGLEISNLTTGAYVVYLKTDSTVKTKKIIIN